MSFPKLTFQAASSSSGEIYYIELSRSVDNLICTCTCTAAENGMHCKHRIGILRGDSSILCGGDIDKMDLVPNMLAGTEVENVLYQMVDLEARKADTDRKLKDIKKQLGRVLAR